MIPSNLYEEAPEWIARKEIMDKNCILIKRIEDIGEAKKVLDEAISHELFNDISKHTKIWTHEDPVIEELLDETRRKLGNLQYILDELHQILHRDYDDY